MAGLARLVADADPERALAIAHAPAPKRAALATLFALDIRFGSILANTSEPQIGAMRLTWWRDALEALDGAAPPPEPLLRAVAAELVPMGIAGGALAAMEDGWMALLEGDPPDAALIARHGCERGGRLFALAAEILRQEDHALTGPAGEGWALADLARRLRDPAAAAEARAQARARLGSIAGRRWPGRLRPIGLLAVLARRDAAAVVPERQGSPARLLRALGHRFTGRLTGR